MQANTGQIEPMTESEAKLRSKVDHAPWIPIPREDEARVTAMPTEDRIRWAANQKRKNRARNKAARAARRVNR